MTDRLPQGSHERPEELIDWNALMVGWDWKINIPVDPDDPDFVEGLDMVWALREQYGAKNVIANIAAMDSDTEQLAKIPGKLGVHVRTGCEPIDPV